MPDLVVFLCQWDIVFTIDSLILPFFTSHGHALLYQVLLHDKIVEKSNVSLSKKSIVLVVHDNNTFRFLSTAGWYGDWRNEPNLYRTQAGKKLASSLCPKYVQLSTDWQSYFIDTSFAVIHCVKK